jgi:hypothetical protein
LGVYSSVSLELPGKATIGQVDFKVTGRLNSAAPWPNFAAGIFYDDGPVDSVKIVVEGREFNVGKGSGVAVYASPCPSPPYTLTMSGKIEFEVEGDYTFIGASGYIDFDRRVFVPDDMVTKSITVERPPEVPWLLIAGVAGVVGLIAVGAVVLIEERRREEMMMAMLLAR